MAEHSTYTTANYKYALEHLKKNNVVITDPDSVKKYLDSRDIGVGRYRIFYLALFHHFKGMNGKANETLAKHYQEMALEYSIKMKQQYENQTLSEREKKVWLDYDEIQAVWQKAKEDNTLSDENKLFLGLNILVPPLRNDYHDIPLFSAINPPPQNYPGNHILIFNKTKAKVYITEHKTSKKFPELVREIPEELMPLLLKLHKEKHYVLFGGITTTRLGQRLQEMMKKYTGKAVGINIIRHAYETKQRGTNELSLKQQKQLSNVMGHSIIESMKYVRR